MFRCICLSLLCISLNVSSVCANIYFNTDPETYMAEFEVCRDPELKVTFQCHPDWRIHHVDDAVIIVISKENPVMTLTVSTFDTNIRFLGQINSRMLKERGLYADGFSMENVEFAQKPAVKVKAYAKDNSERRLVDFFFIQDETLYGVLFTVQPKEAWEEEQFLIQKVLDSFVFYDEVLDTNVSKSSSGDSTK